jgi:hypothetical protein
MKKKDYIVVFADGEEISAAATSKKYAAIIATAERLNSDVEHSLIIDSIYINEEYPRNLIQVQWIATFSPIRS